MSETAGNQRSINSQRSDAPENELVARVMMGDEVALTELLPRYSERLQRMAQLRISPNLASRIDANDVVQEAFLHVSRKLNEYVANPNVPFYLWLRKIAELKLNELYRHHIGTQKRDASREIRILGSNSTAASSVCLANFVVGDLTSPSIGAAKAETKTILAEAFEELDALDREIIALHNFEQLSFSECATILGVSRSTAGSRFLDAVKRLRDSLAKRGITEMPF